MMSKVILLGVLLSIFVLFLQIEAQPVENVKHVQLDVDAEAAEPEADDDLKTAEAFGFGFGSPFPGYYGRRSFGWGGYRGGWGYGGYRRYGGFGGYGGYGGYGGFYRRPIYPVFG